MNASTLFDTAGFQRRYTGFSRQTVPTSSLSGFADRLSAAQQPSHSFVQGPPIYLRMGENILCSGSTGGQCYTAEYTEDSTAEDPIVRITGTSDSGDFDYIRHIRDIDPSHATYAELCALHSHLCRTGAYQSSYKERTGALPTGMEWGDISRKQNFIQKIETFLASASKTGVYPKFGPATYAHARELLGVYQEAAQSGNASVSHQPASYAAAPSPRTGSGKAARDSAFSAYLDVDAQRQKMKDLPKNGSLSSVYMQFMDDYREWKAQQPDMSLPDSQGWTAENLAFLRERYGEGDLSANEIYDALSAMQDMGLLSQKGKDCAAGVTWVRINLSDSGICAVHTDPDSRAAWLHGFDEAPMVGFHTLEDIFSWAQEFQEDDYPDYITHAEALARGWL